MGEDKWMVQMRKGALELCVLALLSRRRRYGYDIVQALSEAQGIVIREGTIYPLLSRLKFEGLLESEWQSSSQGPRRKYYTVTEAGSRRLAELETAWHLFSSDVEDLLDSTTDEPEAGSSQPPEQG